MLSKKLWKKCSKIKYDIEKQEPICTEKTLDYEEFEKRYKKNKPDRDAMWNRLPGCMQ